MREHYAINRARLKRDRMFAAKRAAKERKRMDRVNRDEPEPDLSHTPQPGRVASGFRVTIKCLDDGERVSFTAARTPFGLTISPTAAGRKVAAVLANYTPTSPAPRSIAAGAGCPPTSASSAP